MTWATIITSILSGGTIAAIISIFAPWIQWNVKKRQLVFENRMKIASDAKVALDLSDHKGEFVNTPQYAAIKSYMSRDLSSYLEDPRAMESTRGRCWKGKVYDEICSIEKRWEIC